MVRSEQLFIGGEWVDADGGHTYDTVNPATGETIARCADARQPDVDAAVEQAATRFAHPAWRDIAPAARGELLWRLADLIERDTDELARVETLDQGMPLGVATSVNIGTAIQILRYYAGMCTKIEGKVSALSVPDTMHYTRREPLGVCALITPSNFPFMLAIMQLAPALAAGNTVVVKPAEQTPLSTLRLADLCREAGVPSGVVNVLTGGAEVGKALVEHPRVDQITFTGSTEVGRRIAAAASGSLKRLSLQLGGKAPSIIAEDADIDTAVAGNLAGALLNSGQVCAAYTRFFVHAKRADEFTEKLAARASALKLGPGVCPTTDLGPLVSADHLERVGRYVELGRQEGAELITGGERAGGDLARGYFFRPTVFHGVRDDMTIAREEIFGPVLSVLPYDDTDDLVARANSTRYGLSATVWTKDLRTAHTLAARIRAGSVYVNSLPVLDPAAPHGGFGMSGWGRHMGPDAINEFTETKGVWIGLAS